MKCAQFFSQLWRQYRSQKSSFFSLLTLSIHYEAYAPMHYSAIHTFRQLSWWVMKRRRRIGWKIYLHRNRCSAQIDVLSSLSHWGTTTKHTDDRLKEGRKEKTASNQFTRKHYTLHYCIPVSNSNKKQRSGGLVPNAVAILKMGLFGETAS